MAKAVMKAEKKARKKATRKAARQPAAGYEPVSEETQQMQAPAAPQGPDYPEWARLIRGTAAGIVEEVKQALKHERRMRGLAKKFPDHARSPFSQYMNWVSLLDGVSKEFVRQAAKVQEEADRARFEEGKAHNFWNARHESGSAIPTKRPHDWRARNKWRLAIHKMLELEEAVARLWPAEDILEAKKKAAAQIRLLPEPPGSQRSR